MIRLIWKSELLPVARKPLARSRHPECIYIWNSYFDGFSHSTQPSLSAYPKAAAVQFDHIVH